MERWSRDMNRSPEELLHADRYTVEELSQLLGVGEYEIRRSVREGQLEAEVVNGQIIDIPRAAALRWLESRD